MLIGHQRQLEFIKKSIKQNKLPHAYLFCGEEKLGKKKVALEFISYLLGKNVEKNPHPDFIFVEPLGREIQISQIKELMWRLSLKNFSSPFKIALIDKAHLMNFQSQNCFLKTLEEPKGRTILILITEHPEVLLPTIISRCQIIKFFPVKKSEIKNYLISQGEKEEKAEEIAEFSEGKPGLALTFLSQPQKIKEYQEIISDLGKIFNSGIPFRFQYVKTITEEKDVEELLKIWLWYLRKILLSKIKGISEEFPNLSISKLKNFIEELQKTIFLISTKNINQRLALENLLLNF